jgi:hypothetical protein
MHVGDFYGHSLVVEQRSPKPLVWVRFLVSVPFKKKRSYSRYWLGVKNKIKFDLKLFISV